MNPIDLFLYLLLIALICGFFTKNKFFRIIYIISFLLFVVIVILPTGPFLLWKLENKFPKHEISTNIDGILILGGGTNEFLTFQHNQLNFNNNVERLTESISLIKKFPNAKIVYSGGTPTISKKKPIITGIDVAKKFYLRVDIPIDKFIFENKSKNTYENIIYSKKFIGDTNDENWILLTSAYHMKRAMLVAENQKLNFIPYPVDFRTRKNFTWSIWYLRHYLSQMNHFQLAMHEIIGILAYYLTDKI